MKKSRTFFCAIFASVFLSGCATIRWISGYELPKNTTEDYTKGYTEGREAGKKAPDGYIAAASAEYDFGSEHAPFFVYFSVPPVLPPEVMQQIERASKEYHRGFTSGWLYEVRLTAEKLSWITLLGELCVNVLIDLQRE